MLRALRTGRALLTLPALCGLVAGCSQQSVTVQLHPMQASGAVSYVCRTGSADPNPGLGVPLSECNVGSITRYERELIGLVTQTATGEVAVLDIPLDPVNPRAGEGVVDIDPSTPGYGFLRVGAQPGAIVSTPGGMATFVSSAEAGKPGIYALPTTCLSAPDPDETQRDLTSWPACSLPAAPGAMAIALDAPVDGVVYSACDRSAGADDQAPVPVGECVADLRRELTPPGRRKLLVALPDRGSVAVIDAQSVFDHAPGTFTPCTIEQEVPLAVDLPAAPIAQVIPEDLQVCGPSGLPVPPAPGAFRATPSDFSLVDGTLYVGDTTAPVVHVLDANNPCELTEKQPLLTRSLDNPARVVTTSKVAASPLTPSGKRFVYALDQFDWPTPSVMAFDVSPDSTNRTPIVRPGAQYLPFEPPDRIQFTGSPRDLAFVVRDRPAVDSATGNVVVGTFCDPDPRHDDWVGAKYRPSSDHTAGARPGELRGVFATVLLSNGQLAIVDVEDFDAPCRRPVLPNASDEEDYRGCRNDPNDIAAYVTSAGIATVTDEVSCRMVEPHRARNAYLGITSGTVGIRAPSLRSLPQFSVPDASLQSSFAERPKLLAVEFPAVGTQAPQPASVYVGTTLLSSASGTVDALELDPQRAQRYSLTLPFNEPRAYPANDSLTLTYEGRFTGMLTSGFLEPVTDANDPEASTKLTLRDPGTAFCDAGVNDPELMRDFGSTRFGITDENALDEFGNTHADYVVLASDFPVDDDPYWQVPGLSCSRSECLNVFGAYDATTLSTARDFAILDAQQQTLTITPRGPSAQQSLDPLTRSERVAKAQCCFPSGNKYFVRASQQWVMVGAATGFRHDVIAAWDKDAEGRDILNCERDCNPRKRFFDSRVFEISGTCTPSAGQPGACGVGLQQPGDVCVLEQTTGGVSLSEPAAKCVHQTATARFALYRGEAPSTRDMTFAWQTSGGFTPLRIDLAGLSQVVSPQMVFPLPQLNWVSVVDAASLGLAQLNLDTLLPINPTLN